jgi:hypothetical protein
LTRFSQQENGLLAIFYGKIGMNIKRITAEATHQLMLEMGGRRSLIITLGCTTNQLAWWLKRGMPAETARKLKRMRNAGRTPRPLSFKIG